MKTDLLALLRRVDTYLDDPKIRAWLERWPTTETRRAQLKADVTSAIAEMEQALGPVLAAVPATTLSKCCNAPIEDAGTCADGCCDRWRCTACKGEWLVEVPD